MVREPEEQDQSNVVGPNDGFDERRQRAQEEAADGRPIAPEPEPEEPADPDATEASE